jgi:hypothetical protein
MFVQNNWAPAQDSYQEHYACVASRSMGPSVRDRVKVCPEADQASYVMCSGHVSLEVIWPRSEALHLPPSNGEVEDRRICTAIPVYIYIYIYMCVCVCVCLQWLVIGWVQVMWPMCSTHETSCHQDVLRSGDIAPSVLTLILNGVSGQLHDMTTVSTGKVLWTHLRVGGIGPVEYKQISCYCLKSNPIPQPVAMPTELWLGTGTT